MNRNQALKGYILSWGLVLLNAPVLLAQGEMPPAPVEFAEVQTDTIHTEVSLTGSVQSRKTGTLAISYPGIVSKRWVEPGDRVKRGDQIIALDLKTSNIRLATAEAAVAENKAMLEQARLDLKRQEGLFEKKVTTESDLDAARLRVQSLEGTIKRLDLQAEQVRDEIRRSTVKAPYAGVVTAVHTEVGAWLNAGGPVVDMMSLEQLEVQLSVPETYYRNIREGVRAQVSLPALNNEPIAADDVILIPSRAGTARTLPVRVPFTSDNGSVPTGMLAEVSMITGTGRTVLMIPKDAVVNVGDGVFVCTITDEGVVGRVDIVTGAARGEWIAVEGALSVGDKVITKGNERVFPGQAVVGTPSAHKMETK